MKMFVRISALCLAMASTGTALAQARPDTMRMSCAAAAEMVRRAGAIVLSSGPNIYDRYVVSQGFCPKEEATVPTWVPAGDNPNCFIGFVCQRQSWGAGPP